MAFTSETVEALVEQFTKLPSIGRKTAQRLAAYVLKMPREEVLAIADALVAAKDKVTFCSICHNVTDHDPCSICTSTKRDHSVVCVVEEPSDVLAIERTNEYRGIYHVLGGVISPLEGVGPEDLRIRELLGRIAPDFKRDFPAGGDGKPASGVREPDSGAASSESASSESASHGAASPDAESPDTATAHEDRPGAEIPDEVAAVSIEEVILAVNPNVEGDTTAYYISQLLEPTGVRISRIARGLPIGGDLEYADEATLSRALEGRGGL